MNFAAQAPDLLNNPEIARGLDNAIIAAAIACAISSDESRTLGGSRQHARVIREFTALVEQHAEGPLYLPEVCTALGVSARVFRQCCHDYFGVGPKRYLILRRMHLVRRALLNTIPGEETITSIATRFGFWELGRFSVAYREFFGEAPKATLRKKAPINS
jgi:AraC-like DNA-binding protein